MVDPYDPETVVIGVVGKPHGLRGELSLRPYNVNGEAFDDLEAVILERDGVRTTWAIDELRPAADTVLVRFAGVGDREAAAKLTLSLVRVPRTALPPLDPGEYYVEDVVGCAVFRDDGTALGHAAGTFWNGAHDVMTVAGGDRERMIPLVPEFVVAVDTAARTIRVKWDDPDE